MNINTLVCSTLMGAFALASLTTSANGADRDILNTTPHAAPPHGSSPISLLPTLQPNICNFDGDLRSGIYSRIINNGKILWFGKTGDQLGAEYTGAVIDAHRAAAVSWNMKVQVLDIGPNATPNQKMFAVTELEAPDGSIVSPQTQATFVRSPLSEYPHFILSFNASQLGYTGYKFHHIYLYTFGYSFQNRSNLGNGDITVNGNKPMLLMSLGSECKPLQ